MGAWSRVSSESRDRSGRQRKREQRYKERKEGRGCLGSGCQPTKGAPLSAPPLPPPPPPSASRYNTSERRGRKCDSHRDGRALSEYPPVVPAPLLAPERPRAPGGLRDRLREARWWLMLAAREAEEL